MSAMFDFESNETGRQPRPIYRETTDVEVVAKPERTVVVVISSAEVAQCTCPDFCQRDHDHE